MCLSKSVKKGVSEGVLNGFVCRDTRVPHSHEPTGTHWGIYLVQVGKYFQIFLYQIMNFQVWIGCRFNINTFRYPSVFHSISSCLKIMISVHYFMKILFYSPNVFSWLFISYLKWFLYRSESYPDPQIYQYHSDPIMIQIKTVYLLYFFGGGRN